MASDSLMTVSLKALAKMAALLVLSEIIGAAKSTEGRKRNGRQVVRRVRKKKVSSVTQQNISIMVQLYVHSPSEWVLSLWSFTSEGRSLSDRIASHSLRFLFYALLANCFPSCIGPFACFFFFGGRVR